MNINGKEKKSAVGSGSTNLLISIHRQENSTWQGVAQWLDTGQKVHFRSELELLNLIHEAAEAGRDQERLRSWQDDQPLRAVNR